MSNNFPFEMHLTLSKRFPSGVDEIRFGRYTLKAIPSQSDENGEAVLAFLNTYRSPDSGSHPEEEAINVCRLLSLFLNVRLKKHGIRINSVDIPKGQPGKLYRQFIGALAPVDLEVNLNRVLSLDQDLARQFVRACHVYSFALEFIPADITFAFFLLVVAVECLSSQGAIIPHSQLDLDGKKCERFCHFINTYLPQQNRGNDEKDQRLFVELLKTTYYSHRSGFVHGGREVSIAALMADRAGSSYFKHQINGREVKTPGIGWFAGIVREAILGYLRSDRDIKPDEDLLSKLAYERAGLTLKAKRDLEQYKFVTLDDIEYR